MRIQKIANGSPQSNALVEALARETGQPLDEARRVYESLLQRLDQQSSIKTFLPVLAARQARKILSRPH
jgi:hypothetical protein